MEWKDRYPWLLSYGNDRKGRLPPSKDKEIIRGSSSCQMAFVIAGQS